MKNSKLLLIAAGLLLALTQTSCLKKQNLEASELGAPVDANMVQDKMTEGIGDLYFEDVRVNESNSMNASTTYEDSQNIKVFNQTIVVSSVSDTATALTINLDYSKIDYINSESSFNHLAYPFVIPKSLQTMAALKKPDLSQKSAPRPWFLFQVYAYMAISGCRDEKVTCHNFSFVDSNMTLASNLADPRICHDGVNCIIPTRKIEFDALDGNRLQSDGKPTRSHYKFVVSSVLPFFSKVLLYCVRELADYNDRKVLAEDCVSVNNFTVGD